MLPDGTWVPDGAQVSGRYPSWARSCCSRSVENGAVVKCRVTVAASRPPACLCAPAADCTPEDPPGTVTVTSVPPMNPAAGVNTAESPSRFQVPGIAGDTFGIGELAASGAEKVTRTGRVPLTSCAPEAGLIAVTRSGGAGCTVCAGLAAGLPAWPGTLLAWSDTVCELALLPGPAASVEIPAIITMAAAAAVTAAERFARLTPRAGKACGSHAESDIRRRDHVKIGTAPSLRSAFSR